MKVTKPVLVGFASLGVIVSYLIHPILSVIALIVFIATLSS